MLATAWGEAFDDPDWWFEVKWDGYRCIARRHGAGSMLRSRRGLDMAQRFPEVAAVSLPPGWTFDGEVVAFDDDGRPRFSLIQMGRPATYVVFDVLHSPHGPLVQAPFEERRQQLASLELPPEIVVDRPIRQDGRALYQAVLERGMEGIVAKRAGSPYQPGKRSPDWRKVAARHRLRAVVGGWLPGDGGRRATFGSVLIGLWDGDRLRWTGAVGSGFDDDTLRRLGEILSGIERDTPPFADTAGIPRYARWVEPVVTIAVEYKEWTHDLRLRAPVFKGVEIDGEPPTWEAEGPST